MERCFCTLYTEYGAWSTNSDTATTAVPLMSKRDTPLTHQSLSQDSTHSDKGGECPEHTSTKQVYTHPCVHIKPEASSKFTVVCMNSLVPRPTQAFR